MITADLKTPSSASHKIRMLHKMDILNKHQASEKNKIIISHVELNANLNALIYLNSSLLDLHNKKCTTLD